MLPLQGRPALTPKVLSHPTHLGPGRFIGGWADKEKQMRRRPGESAGLLVGGLEGVQPGPSTPGQLLAGAAQGMLL